MAEVKKSKKVAKEEKYKKLLETIDLKLQGEAPKAEANKSIETTSAVASSSSNEKFSISSLLSRIEGN